MPLPMKGTCASFDPNQARRHCLGHVQELITHQLVDYIQSISAIGITYNVTFDPRIGTGSSEWQRLSIEHKWQKTFPARYSPNFYGKEPVR